MRERFAVARRPSHRIGKSLNHLDLAREQPLRHRLGAPRSTDHEFVAVAR
jgi:hypothetical protein